MWWYRCMLLAMLLSFWYQGTISPSPFCTGPSRNRILYESTAGSTSTRKLASHESGTLVKISLSYFYTSVYFSGNDWLSKICLCHHQIHLIHLWFKKTAGLRWNQRDQHLARSMSLSHSADADVESSERRRYARHAYVVSTVDSQEDVAIFWDPGMSLRRSATIWMPIRS